jgi:hypothetical protein
MKKELPSEPFPQIEFPSYFSLFQNKPVILSKIFQEDINLGNAVLRLMSSGHVESFKVPKIGHKGYDYIVRMREKPPIDKPTAI